MKNLAATKIIATIGPSSWDRDILEEMFKNGMRDSKNKCFICGFNRGC